MPERHRVVILGGGFGGLHAAQELKRAPVDVTLIDRRNYHLFQPLLYQVATGSLSPGEIAAPIRGVLRRQRNARVLLGAVVDIDVDARLVKLRDGAAVPYDSLIVATGSRSTYFGNEQWRDWAPSLKTIEDATCIRHKILYAFEAAERIEDPAERRAWLTFVIVGAGPTGVELAGALGEIAHESLPRNFRSIRPEEAQIIILDGSPRVLPVYPAALSRKAERMLIRLGVRVRNQVRVTQVDSEGVSFEGSHGAAIPSGRIPAKTVLWAAGVTASELGRILGERTGAAVDRQGCVAVNQGLTLPNHPEIFVVGDVALAARQDGTPLPGVAQVAIQQGSYAARVIRRRLDGAVEAPPFRYFDKGDLAVIGRGSAVANTFGLHLSGLFAWLIWLFIHLMYIVEFQSRLLVFVQWGFLYLTSNRGALLITGHAASDVLERPATMKTTHD